MKNSFKLLTLTICAGIIVSTNTSCTPTEAAIVGAVAGAAIGAAAADSHYNRSYYRGRGHYNRNYYRGRGHYNRNYYPSRGYYRGYRGGGPYCY